MRTHYRNSLWLLLPVLCIAWMQFSFAQTNQEQERKIKEHIAKIEQEKNMLTDEERKISSEVFSGIKKIKDYTNKGKQKTEIIQATDFESGLQINPSGQVNISVKLMFGKNSDLPMVKSKIEELGGRIYNVTEQGPTFPAEIYCWIKPENIITLSEVHSIVYIGSLSKGLYWKAPTTEIITPGYGQLEADITYTRFGLTGNGVKVGTISDGASSRTAVKNAGELPFVSVRTGNEGTANANEGTGMMEIIHDLAPNASLYFAGLVLDETAPNVMANKINELATDGCRVIVDDIPNYDGSFFSNQTPLGLAIYDFITAGNTYVAATGNDQKDLYNGVATFDANYYLKFNDNSTSILVNVPAKNEINIYLQWSTKWELPSTDLDIYAFDGVTPVGVGGTTRQADHVNPKEKLTISNTSNLPITYTIKIKSYTVTPQTDLEYTFIIPGYSFPDNNISNTGPHHVFGHRAFPGVISVAAYHADQPLVLADYSSQGKALMDGVWQNTPTITATSNVDTYVGLNGLWKGPNGESRNPFGGTSAAAPHVAGLAALYYQKFSTNTGTNFYTHLTTSAKTLNSTYGPGGTYNEKCGFGKASIYETIIKALPVQNYNNQTLTTNTYLNGVRLTGSVTVSNNAVLDITSCVVDGNVYLTQGTLSSGYNTVVRSGRVFDTDYLTSSSAPYLFFEDPYKTVHVKQIDASNVSFGQFGKLRNGSFALFSEKDFLWPIGSNQTIQSDQNFKSGTTQKYHDWNSLSDVVNHHPFGITSQTVDLTSKFIQTENTITIKNVLIDNLEGGDVYFKDPWLIDEQVNVGSQLVYRNRGMNADHLAKPYPFILSSGTYSNHKGVFLGENPTFDPAKPIYSVRAPLIHSNINGVSGSFLNWSATNAQLSQVGSNPSGYDQKAVVFTNSNATVTATYKAHLASNSTAALSSNSQRKIVKWGTTHLVYCSAGDIWYTRSTDNGTTWGAEEKVSTTYPQNYQWLNPAIDVDGSGTVFIAYECVLDATHRAMIIKKKITNGWEFLNQATGNTFLASSDLKPTIQVSKQNSSVYGLQLTVVVQAGGYTTSDPGLYFFYVSPSGGGYQVGKVSETSSSSLNPTICYQNIAYQEGNAIYHKRIEYGTTPISFSTRQMVSTTGANGRPLSNISNPSIAIREGVDHDYSYRPIIAWQAQDVVFGSYRPIFVRHPVSSINSENPNFVTTIFNWGTYGQAGRTPTVNCYQTPGGAGFNNPDVSVVWQEEASDSWGGSYPKVVVANKINGTWNAQTTLATSAQNSSLAQGDVYQSSTSGSDAVVGWSGTSSPIFSLSASQKTNGGVPPPLPPPSGKFAKGNSATNNTAEYAREININLGTLGIEGLKGTVCFHIEETTDAKFAPLGELGPLEKDFLKLQAQTQSATTKYKVWVFDLQLSQALLIPQRGLEIFSLLVGKDSVTTRKKNFTLENLLGLWKANHSKLGSAEVVQDSGEVVVPTGTFVQVQTRQDTASQTSGVTYLQIIAPDDGEQLRKQAKQEIIANQLPTEFALASNYPNPFNPTTTINYALPQAGNVILKVYDALGREVTTLVNEYKNAGRYEVQFDASTLASGIYFYRIVAVKDNDRQHPFTEAKKLVLVR